MKKLLSIIFVTFLSSTIFAQIEEIPKNIGDNFSLEGALTLLKKSKSIEEFENLINDQTNNVNNLDLNNDGQTDYISVEDLKEKNSHVLVLSTELSATEKQDIATINIEKTDNEQATLQIIGDANLYASNTIIEPFETSQYIHNSKGPNVSNIEITQIFVNVWFWPSIQFLYAPTYIIWRSPYHWTYYPQWYRPWHPFRYHNFYARSAPNRLYFRPTPVYRVNYSRQFYAPQRHYSTLIINNRSGKRVIYDNRYRTNTKKFRNRNNHTHSNTRR